MAIKLVAQEEDYYDLKRDDPKIDKDLVDRLLGRTEIASAGTIQKLMKAPFFNLSLKEKAYLYEQLELIKSPPVRSLDGTPIRDLFVLELSVAPGDPTCLYRSANGRVWVKTPGGTQVLNDEQINSEL